MRKTVLTLLGVVLCTCAMVSTARADETLRLRVDWNGLGALLRHYGAGMGAHESPRDIDRAVVERDSAEPSPWLGLAPRVSLVARDWGASQVLWGELSLTDQMRLTRSSRMVVTRVRFANGRLVPFAQVGLGQWRVDTALVSSLSTEPHPAAQLGGGFELEVAPRASVAAEGDCTMMYEEGHSLDPLASARVWTAMLAARARF